MGGDIKALDMNALVIARLGSQEASSVALLLPGRAEADGANGGDGEAEARDAVRGEEGGLPQDHQPEVPGHRGHLGVQVTALLGEPGSA